MSLENIVISLMLDNTKKNLAEKLALAYQSLGKFESENAELKAQNEDYEALGLQHLALKQAVKDYFTAQDVYSIVDSEPEYYGPCQVCGDDGWHEDCWDKAVDILEKAESKLKEMVK